MKFDLGPISTD